MKKRYEQPVTEMTKVAMQQIMAGSTGESIVVEGMYNGEAEIESRSTNNRGFWDDDE